MEITKTLQIENHRTAEFTAACFLCIIKLISTIKNSERVCVSLLQNKQNETRFQEGTG